MHHRSSSEETRTKTGAYSSTRTNNKKEQCGHSSYGKARGECALYSKKKMDLRIRASSERHESEKTMRLAFERFIIGRSWVRARRRIGPAMLRPRWKRMGFKNSSILFSEDGYFWWLSVFIRMWREFASWKNFGESRKFGEPNHLSDIYLPVHVTQCFRTGR